MWFRFWSWLGGSARGATLDGFGMCSDLPPRRPQRTDELDALASSFPLGGDFCTRLGCGSPHSSGLAQLIRRLGKRKTMFRCHSFTPLMEIHEEPSSSGIMLSPSRCHMPHALMYCNSFPFSGAPIGGVPIFGLAGRK